ncbi:MAG: hypothetical protein ACI4TA_10610 [Acetatifactor sp.]
MSVMQETQKIAAVVLFKDLHSKKMDVYDVLAAFIGDIIVEKGLTKFSAVDMSRYLVDDFGFDSIPQNVIKNAIRRTELTESRDGFFLVKREHITGQTSTMGFSLEEEIAKNDDIINGACTYIEGKRGVKLSEKEKEEITKSFCAFLLDSKCEQKYIAEVASYIISLEGTPAQKRIEEITEGVYQYAALTYNEDISKIEKLKNDMVIFLDTEALLSFGGFHGEIHKQYIDEMLQLISEINEKTRKRYMSVKYMDYVKKEVDDVFNSAIFYVQGKNFYTRDAAESIAEGCKSEEDVMEKRANFYSRLKAKGIAEFTFPDRYSEINEKYNLEGDTALKDLVSEEVSEKDIEKGAKRVSDINKLRKGIQYKNFEEIKFVFVSDNGKVQTVNSYYCKQLSCYNFVMGCSKMTNILWLKMNKGLSKAALPSSLEAVTRSRVVVSSFTSAKMRSEMKIVNSKIESGELERDALYEMLGEFKNYAKRPEDITADSLDINIRYIESEMKTYGEELSLYKSEVETERGKRGTVVNAFKQYSIMVERRDSLIRDKDEKNLQLEEIMKRNKIAKVICWGIRGVLVLICFAVIWGLLTIINKGVMVEWVANREWLLSLIITILFTAITIVYGNKIDKETIIIGLLNKIDTKVFGWLNATSEQIDNLKFLLEGIENRLIEAEKMMEEYKLQADAS